MNRIVKLIFILLIAVSGFSQSIESNEYITTLGNFKEFTFDEQTLLIIADNGKLKITHYTDEIVRISVCRDEFGPEFKYSVIREPEGKFSLRHNWSVFELTTPSLKIVVNRYPVYITFYDRKGKLLNQDHPEMAYTFTKNSTYCFKKIQKSEVFVSPFFDNEISLCNNKSLSWPNSGFYIAINDKKFYGIFSDNLKGTSYDFGTLQLNENHPGYLHYSTENSVINYYMISGKNPKEIIKSYSYLVGLPLLPPIWSLQNISKLNLNYKSIDYLVHNNDSNTIYGEGSQNSYYLKYCTGNGFNLFVNDNEYSFLDFTNPLAAKWWMKSNFDGVNQADYLTIYDVKKLRFNNIPDFIMADFEGHSMTFDNAKNNWGFLISKSAYENLSNKIYRPFIYNHFNFPGIHRYSFKINSIGDEDAYHLLIKNSFSEFCNAEFTIASYESNNIFIDESRKRLLPYIYSNYKIFSKSGLPVRNSMAIFYPEISKQKLSKFDNQFIFCKNILVCPSYTIIPKDHEVFLPSGSNWFLLQNDSIYEGGKIHASPAHQKFVPVFIKSSSIIPQKSLKENSDTLFIHIYYGERTNTFDYYEDDGITNNFKKGQYYSRKITFDPNKNLILLNSLSGLYPSIYNKLTFVFHGFEFKNKLKLNGEKIDIIKNGKLSIINTDNIVSPIIINY
ncbi:DUF5110 domain-containing protein [Bacteroidota bacterium]